MRRYSIVGPLVRSIWSMDVYVDVGRRWRGLGLLYLLLITTTAWAIACIGLHVQLNQSIDSFLRPIAQQLPKITITKGVAASDPPYAELVDPRTGKVVAVIDTAGQLADPNEAKADILMTSTHAWAREDGVMVRGIAHRHQAFELTPVKAMQTLDQISRWGAVLAFTIGLIILFVYRSLLMLAFAGIGMLVISQLGSRLTFKDAYRLSAVALTPAIWFETVWYLWAWAGAAGRLPVLFDFALMVPISFGIAVVYVVVGIKAASESLESERASLDDGSNLPPVPPR